LIDKTKTALLGGSLVYGYWWRRGELNPPSERKTIRVSPSAGCDLNFAPLAAAAGLRGSYLDESPFEPPRIGPRASPFKLRLIPGHGPSAGETLRIKPRRLVRCCWQL